MQNQNHERLTWKGNEDKFRKVSADLKGLKQPNGERLIGAEFWIKPNAGTMIARHYVNKYMDVRDLLAMASRGELYFKRK